MKKNPVDILTFALTGIGYGIPATLICMALLGGWQEPLGELTVWTIASARIGLLSGVIFGSDRLGLPAALTIHGTCTYLVVTAACWINGYDSSLMRILTGILPVFLLIYAVIYAINYFSFKAAEKQINQALDNQN